MPFRVYRTAQSVTADQIYRLVKAFSEIDDHDTREAIIRFLESAPCRQRYVTGLEKKSLN